MFYLYSPEGATISLWQRHIGWISQIFLPPPSQQYLLLRVKNVQYSHQLYNALLPTSRFTNQIHYCNVEPKNDYEKRDKMKW